MINLEAPCETTALASRFSGATPDRARLFSVLEGRAPGRVVVDRAHDPSWAVVRSAWFGRVFIAGDISAKMLAHVIGALRLDGMVHLDLDDPCASLFPSGRVDTLPRLEFCRQLTHGGALRNALSHAPQGCEIREIDAQAFEHCRWRSDLLAVFDSAEEYLTQSLGFGLFAEGALVCEAHGFFWGGRLVEIGAITAPECRGRRYAAFTVAHLVAACEARGYTTYWGCDLSNAASTSVAVQLGYGQPRPYSVAYYPAAV